MTTTAPAARRGPTTPSRSGAGAHGRRCWAGAGSRSASPGGRPFGIGTTEFVSMGLLPEIASDLGATVPEGGHLVSAYALGVVVGAPLVAVLAARLPRTGLLVVLMSAFAVGNALSALAPGFGSLVAGAVRGRAPARRLLRHRRPRRGEPGARRAPGTRGRRRDVRPHRGQPASASR